MADSRQQRQIAFKETIERFLAERLSAKLDKLEPDDPKCEELIAQYAFDAWLSDAARRVAQIQAVTHSLKPIHPDARGTNLYRPPDALPQHAEVGSHVLGNDFSGDVVGNAAALDVYKLLKLSVDGRALLDWMLEADPALASALSDDPAESRAWMDAFTGITQSRDSTPASHARAKQLYWLTGDDPLDDHQYQLLAPLYASSLAHAVFQTINEDRFGEAGKAARKAKREHADHDTGYREYPSLAVQKLGGTKPQNISQLNSERGGSNYLLASLPPRWQSRSVRQPWLIDSVFPRFGRGEEVRRVVRALRDFLASNPDRVMETRDRREEYTDALIDELIVFSTELQTALPSGWSDDPRCQLAEAEQLWLDPGRADDDEDFRVRWEWMDWPAEIGGRFGNWLNAQLSVKLPMGDIEQRNWQKELLLDERPPGWARRLHKLRKGVTSPPDVPPGGNL